MTDEQNTRTKLKYDNKIILAPMVRVGTLPMRLMALRYGAEIVYSEEIIDWKLLKSFRQVNGMRFRIEFLKLFHQLIILIFADVLGTVDYIDELDGNIVFRTCAIEKDKLVLQLGTASSERALKIAKMVKFHLFLIESLI